jgi:hypothetical protein
MLGDALPGRHDGEGADVHQQVDAQVEDRGLEPQPRADHHAGQEVAGLRYA